MDTIQLIVAFVAFVFAATLIPLSKAKKKDKRYQTIRTVAFGMLMLAALLAMISPGN